MPINIILVEDDEDIRSVLTTAMRPHYDVTECADGRDALEKLESAEEPFLIAVVDLWMPGMDGLTLIEKIREREEWNDLSIIIITGIVPERDLPERFWTKHLGIEAFFHKPFHPQDLVNKINEVARRKLGLKNEDDNGGPRGGYL